MTQFLLTDNRIRLPVLPCGTEFKHYLTRLGLIKDVINLIWSYMDVYVETEFHHIFARAFQGGNNDDFIHYKEGSRIKKKDYNLVKPQKFNHFVKEDVDNDCKFDFKYALTTRNGLNCDWITTGYAPFEDVVCQNLKGIYPLDLNHMVGDQILMFWSYHWKCLNCVKRNNSGNSSKDVLIGRGFYAREIINAKDGDLLTHDGICRTDHLNCPTIFINEAKIKITIKNGIKLIECLPSNDYK